MPIQGKKKGDKRLIAIGEALRYLRKEKGISSYYSIANDMHISPSQYWRYEKGANMNLDTLLAILDFLDTPLDVFVTDYLSKFEN